MKIKRVPIKSLVKKMQIKSLQNEKIKRLINLISKNNKRRKNETFVVEGLHENKRAIQFGYKPIEFFVCNEIFQDKIPDASIHFVSKKVYETIAYRGSSEGIIGIYKEKHFDFSNFTPQPNSSIILLESIEKPGNLGAILRSCEAFGIDAVIITNSKIDFYNPNVIRSSIGCLFGINFFQTKNEYALEFLKKHNYQIITTFMYDHTQQIQKSNFKKKTVICFGSEHSGLSNFWKDRGKNCLIPMIGSIDSLNLSNSVAITCYEILKQKLQ